MGKLMDLLTDMFSVLGKKGSVRRGGPTAEESLFDESGKANFESV